MQALSLGLWEKEREEVIQLAVFNFQFQLLETYMLINITQATSNPIETKFNELLISLYSISSQFCFSLR